MNQSPPFWNDDADAFIYKCNQNEIDFSLNMRKLSDTDFKGIFNKFFVKSLSLDVAFFDHNKENNEEDDTVRQRYFSILNKSGVDVMYGIPACYKYDKTNSLTDEIVCYSPALIGRIISSFDQYTVINRGLIRNFSGSYYLFSPCLTYAKLVVEGEYSLMMGPRIFLESVLQQTVEDSWSPVRTGKGIDNLLLPNLREALAAYGY